MLARLTGALAVLGTIGGAAPDVLREELALVVLHEGLRDALLGREHLPRRPFPKIDLMYWFGI